MLYVDTDPTKWAKKYGLTGIDLKCRKCGQSFRASRPFVMKDYAGLATPEHGCGEAFAGFVATPTSAEKKAFWNEVVG